MLQAYIIIMLVYNALTWQSSCVIANNARKTTKVFVQGYNLKVHMKTSCHCNVHAINKQKP